MFEQNHTEELITKARSKHVLVNQNYTGGTYCSKIQQNFRIHTQSQGGKEHSTDNKIKDG
jgi:hypothetical protein